MELDVRSPTRLIPSYSLTGDVLSFARCGLQYRLHRVGALPPSRPVQMWFGQFLHGVLEEGYRRYTESQNLGAIASESAEICSIVELRLGASGLRARNRRLEELAHHRASVLLSDLAPLLFPFVSQAEVRLTATRSLKGGTERYQMTGVVDVISSIDLNQAGTVDNPLISRIRGAAGDQSDPYEVIVDYKGMGRPELGAKTAFNDIYDWQILTYAELRHRQNVGATVKAATLIYLNELAPTWQDLERVSSATAVGGEKPRLTDKDRAVLQAVFNKSRRSSEWPLLTLDYRMERALRILEVKPQAVRTAVDKFDEFVEEIEGSKSAERSTGSVIHCWANYSNDPATCVACDWKLSCPAPAK